MSHWIPLFGMVAFVAGLGVGRLAFYNSVPSPSSGSETTFHKGCRTGCAERGLGIYSFTEEKRTMSCICDW